MGQLKICSYLIFSKDGSSRMASLGCQLGVKNKGVKNQIPLKIMQGLITLVNDHIFGRF